MACAPAGPELPLLAGVWGVRATHTSLESSICVCSMFAQAGSVPCQDEQHTVRGLLTAGASAQHRTTLLVEAGARLPGGRDESQLLCAGTVRLFHAGSSCKQCSEAVRLRCASVRTEPVSVKLATQVGESAGGAAGCGKWRASSCEALYRLASAQGICDFAHIAHQVLFWQRLGV